MLLRYLKLFTNVPLEETINICADALYCDDSDAQPFTSKAVFIKLMKSATSGVEFSFNDIMYKQTDGVAMGSPLGPALANIFVGFCEKKFFSQISKPSTYFRYVDDTFAIFYNEEELENFFNQLNRLHFSLKFTFEKEKNNCLPFLDVNVERTATGFETSVYRKPTFTGQYLRWESFSPNKQKTNLISTLVHRALMICTKSKLNQKIKHIKNILLDYGFPESIIDSSISKKIAQFSMPKRFGPEKCQVYLRVPWIRKASISLDKNVKMAVESCYGSITTRMVFTFKRMLPVARKDVLPTMLKSSVIYEYSCHCDSRYVRRTSQRLQDRIKQHVPKWLQQQAKRPTRSQPDRSCKLKRKNPDCDSAIGQHLLDNEQCAANYSNDKRFRILAVARNSFHLCLLDATFIKTRYPVLCKQNEFVYTLKLQIT